MAILIVRHVERGSARSRVLPAIVAGGLVLGLLIIRADEQHAEVGRRGGAVVASYVERGEKVWFDGTWAFQWYAMQAGGIPMTSAEPRPQPGDIVVAGTESWMIYGWRNKTMLEKLTFDSPGGRIFDRPAGFSSNVGWGPLPWRWSSKPYKPITVWRVLPP